MWRGIWNSYCNCSASSYWDKNAVRNHVITCHAMPYHSAAQSCICRTSWLVITTELLTHITKQLLKPRHVWVTSVSKHFFFFFFINKCFLSATHASLKGNLLLQGIFLSVHWTYHALCCSLGNCLIAFWFRSLVSLRLLLPVYIKAYSYLYSFLGVLAFCTWKCKVIDF